MSPFLDVDVPGPRRELCLRRTDGDTQVDHREALDASARERRARRAPAQQLPDANLQHGAASLSATVRRSFGRARETPAGSREARSRSSGRSPRLAGLEQRETEVKLFSEAAIA